MTRVGPFTPHYLIQEVNPKVTVAAYGTARGFKSDLETTSDSENTKSKIKYCGHLWVELFFLDKVLQNSSLLLLFCVLLSLFPLSSIMPYFWRESAAAAAAPSRQEVKLCPHIPPALIEAFYSCVFGPVVLCRPQACGPNWSAGDDNRQSHERFYIMCSKVMRISAEQMRGEKKDVQY